MAHASRWLEVPLVFSGLLWLALVIRWLPAGIHQGIVLMIAGDISLGWPVLLRGGVLLLATIPFLGVLPPLRKIHVLYVAVAASAVELAVEVCMGRLVGAKAAMTIQLAATGVAYLMVLLIGGWLLRGMHRLGQI
jgi:hypothetical protein